MTQVFQDKEFFFVEREMVKNRIEMMRFNRITTDEDDTLIHSCLFFSK